MTTVPASRGELQVVELDADRALARWIAARRHRLRTILGRGTYLDDDDVDRFLGLSLPGVNELIGLVELARLARARHRDEVIVDTAPTGHTLRLLAMPETLGRIAEVLDGMQGKHRFLAESLGGRWQPDDTDELIGEIAGASRDLGALLRDRGRAALSWVLLPEALALAETRDAVGALEAAGIAVSELIVNRVIEGAPRGCAFCAARANAERRTMAAARAAFPGRPLRLVPELDHEPRGLAALRHVARALDRPARTGARPPASVPATARPRRRANPATAEAALDALAPGGLRLLLFAGKGGTGKTSCAAAVALALAARDGGRRVLLLSTDPAHSLADVLAAPLGDEPRPVPGAPLGLTARELDADRAFADRRARYRQAVDDLFVAFRSGTRFETAFDRQVVADLIDLAPSGLDELFGILAVTEAVEKHDIVVVDTAPTGHALRLLAMADAALEWVHALMAILLKYRQAIGLSELGLDLVEAARDLRRLGALLRDPARTRLVPVARPSEMVRLETARLIRQVRRLGIPQSAIVVNAVTAPTCVRCRRAAAGQAPVLAAQARECRSLAGGRCAMILAPMAAPPPRGIETLARWRATWELHEDPD